MLVLWALEKSLNYYFKFGGNWNKPKFLFQDGKITSPHPFLVIIGSILLSKYIIALLTVIPIHHRHNNCCTWDGTVEKPGQFINPRRALRFTKTFVVYISVNTRNKLEYCRNSQQNVRPVCEENRDKMTRVFVVEIITEQGDPKANPYCTIDDVKDSTPKRT